MSKLQSFVAFVVTLFSLLPALLFSQVDTAWVRRYNGPGSYYDFANAIVTDGSGNVYVTGASTGSSTSDDYATIKYDSSGVRLWVQRYNGPGNSGDYANAIAADPSGNVYVTGGSRGSGTEYDYATIKYNATGVQQWVARYVGNGDDAAFSLALDGVGNVYVTGYSAGSGTDYDYATIKYNTSGETLWVKRYNGPGNGGDCACAIAVDNSGNVYVTGYSSGLSTEYDYATIKYNSNGVEQWVQRYNGPANNADEARAIAVDNSGNVYVTGGSGIYPDYDYATIKYNSAGVQQWVQRYNGPANSYDDALAITHDNSGNVYVTGYSYGSAIDHDYVTIKYNSSGIEQWLQRYDGPGNSNDRANAIASDNSGNVYVTGYSYGSSIDYDYTTIKYNSSGVQQWVARYDGPANSEDWASAIAVTNSGKVYVTGYSIGSGISYYDYATIKYVQTQGIEEVRGEKLAASNVKIYPNPAKTYFTVRCPQSADRSQIKIFNTSGKLIKEIASQARNDNNVRISLTGIKNGIYFVSWETDGKRTIERLVIVK